MSHPSSKYRRARQVNTEQQSRHRLQGSAPGRVPFRKPEVDPCKPARASKCPHADLPLEAGSYGARTLSPDRNRPDCGARLWRLTVAPNCGEGGKELHGLCQHTIDASTRAACRSDRVDVTGHLWTC